MKEDKCKQRLIEGTQKLDPILNQLGFVFEISETGVSRGGDSFAAGFYKNGDKAVGLIYRSTGGLIFRSTGGLGAVIYNYRQLSVSHSNLMRYLGKRNVSKLRYETNRFMSYPIKFMSYAKGGGNVFDALAHDIQNYGMEFLTSPDDQFESTLKEIAKSPEPKDISVRSIILGLIELLIVLSAIISLLRR